MRRMKTMHKAVALIATGFFLAAAPLLLATTAAATPANFDSEFGFLDTGLEALPSYNMGPEDPFLGAGEVGVMADVNLTGSTDICILFGDSTCRSTTAGITGPFSVIVTVQVTAINNPIIDGPFTLMLSSLMGNTYSTSEVSVELDPVAPTGLVTTAVPGFVWNGGFTPLVHVIHDAPNGQQYDYIGWQVQLNDFVTFQYDVSTAPGLRVAPQLGASATAVVPEPGTTLLMGLGLAGLASIGRRTARQD